MAVLLDVRLPMTASAPSQGPNRGKVPRNLRLNLLKHTNGDELGPNNGVVHAAVSMQPSVPTGFVIEPLV